MGRSTRPIRPFHTLACFSVIMVAILVTLSLYETVPPSLLVSDGSSNAPITAFLDAEGQLFEPLSQESTPLGVMNDTGWKTELLSHYAFALISSQKLHHRLQWALKSWWVPEYNSIVEVFSDSTNVSSLNFTIPNLVNTGCPPSYNFGLWCKNDFLFERWAKDPKYKNVKWFYRGMDDSGIHMENLVWLTQQYDYRKPIVIGERICLHQDYPDGGPGILMSRAFIESPTLRTSWNISLTKRGLSYILDDYLYGKLILLEKAQFYHSSGISHEPFSNNSEIYRYYLRQRGHPWPLSYRPVLYHQAKATLSLMPTVHRDLQGIDFANLETKRLFTPPNCLCWGHIHSRCGWSLEIMYINKTRTACSWPNGFVHCIFGAAPVPNPLPGIRDIAGPMERVREGLLREKKAKDATTKPTIPVTAPH